jgi:ParB/RepB/Spo0J family partition protein
MEGYQLVDLGRIKPSPMNPRKHFGGPKDEELIASVRSKGVLQPIVIRLSAEVLQDEVTGRFYPAFRRKGAKGHNVQGQGHESKGEAEAELGKMAGSFEFEIVAGERRWRAACVVAKETGGLAGATIPAMVRTLTDDEAFDVMTIENLQREDLSERDEAEGFKAYLDRKGEEALPDLASRTGIDPRYIRRRVRILTLPTQVLEAWEKGKLAYGHLEQLRRLEDPGEIKRFFKEALGSSVGSLKEDIDRMSVPLGKAEFKPSEAGCAKCPSNSEVQNDLFGTAEGKSVCLDPACFLEKTRLWLTENWEKSRFRKRFQTNGFRFHRHGDNLQAEGFYGYVPKKECKVCSDFLTILSEHDPFEPYQGLACLNPACYRKTVHRSSSGRRQVDPKEISERRSTEHGVLFREEFFQTRIPSVFSKVAPEDPRVDALALLSLVSSNRGLHSWFYKSIPPDEQKTIPTDKFGSENPENEDWFWIDQKEMARIIRRLPIQFIRMLLHDAALEVIMQKEFGHDGRYRVASWLGMDLGKEWMLNQEYLEAKTKAEMLSMGESLGILKDPKAQAFLYEKLGKKRGKIDTCKKTELIRVFLESGVDLAGKVPDEILVKAQKCRVCGCTDDHACPGGCYWVEKDLCSACADKQKGKKKSKKKVGDQ